MKGRTQGNTGGIFAPTLQGRRLQLAPLNLWREAWWGRGKGETAELQVHISPPPLSLGKGAWPISGAAAAAALDPGAACKAGQGRGGLWRGDVISNRGGGWRLLVEGMCRLIPPPPPPAPVALAAARMLPSCPAPGISLGDPGGSGSKTGLQPFAAGSPGGAVVL